MVLAVGPQGPSDSPPPQSVKEKVNAWWWALVVFYLALLLARFYVGDLWGGMITTCMGFWAWWMVRSDCKQMSQYCVMMFGMLCFFEVLIDLVNFLSCIQGRVQEEEQESPLGASSNGAVSVQYTISIVEHPFFDKRLGFMYNFQSLLMVIILLCDALGVTLSYWTYHKYPSSLFDDSDDEESQHFRASPNQPLNGFGGSQLGGTPYGSSGNNHAAIERAAAVASGRQVTAASNLRVFEGTGQRLCDLDTPRDDK